MLRMTRRLQGYLCPLVISLLSTPSASIEGVCGVVFLPKESVNDSFASDVQSDIFDGTEDRKKEYRGSKE